MYSTLIFMLFVSVLLLYNLSKKASWEGKPGWAVLLESKPFISRFMSIITLLFCCLIFMLLSGVGSGLFGFFVMLMCVFSVIIVLFPFRYLSTFQVLLIYALFLFSEILFNYAS